MSQSDRPSTLDQQRLDVLHKVNTQIQKQHTISTANLTDDKSEPVSTHSRTNTVRSPQSSRTSALSPSSTHSDWQQYTDDDGNVYYHNHTTGVSQWTNPHTVQQTTQSQLEILESKPEYWAVLLNDSEKQTDSSKLQRLYNVLLEKINDRILLTAWKTSFIRQNGLVGINRLLSSFLWGRIHEDGIRVCIQILQLLLNDGTGIRAASAVHGLINHIVKCLKSRSIQCQSYTLQLLTVCCYFCDNGCQVVVDALHAYDEEDWGMDSEEQGTTVHQPIDLTINATAIKLLLDMLDHNVATQIRCDVLTLINALINCNQALDARLSLRKCFVDGGILQSIDSLSGWVEWHKQSMLDTETQIRDDVVVQLKVYHDSSMNDKRDLMWHNVDLTDIHAVFDVLQQTAQDTGFQSQLLNALQLLLAIPKTTELAEPIWNNVVYMLTAATNDVKQITGVPSQITSPKDQYFASTGLQHNRLMTVQNIKELLQSKDQLDSASQSAQIISLEATVFRLNKEITELKQTIETQHQQYKKLQHKYNETESALKIALKSHTSGTTLVAVQKVVESLAGITVTPAGTTHTITPNGITRFIQSIQPASNTVPITPVNHIPITSTINTSLVPPTAPILGDAAPTPPGAPNTTPEINPIRATFRFQHIPKPSIKLKPLHWSKIDETAVSAQYWQSIHDIDINVKPSELDTLFANKRVTAPHNNVQSPQSAIERQLPHKREVVELLSGKRLYAVDIGLARLRHSYISIRDSILDMDDSIIDTDMLQHLLKVIPTNEEINELYNYLSNDGDITVLSKTCQFMYMMASIRPILHITSLQQRCELYLFKQTYTQLVESIEHQLDIVQVSINEINASTGLKQILSMILYIGNYMNYDTRNGNAIGFKLCTFSQLKLTKSTESDMTLLDYIVSYVQQNKLSYHTFVTELQHIKQASQIDLSIVYSDINNIKKQITALQYALQPNPAVVDVYTQIHQKRGINNNAVQSPLSSMSVNSMHRSTAMLPPPDYNSTDDRFETVMTMFYSIAVNRFAALDIQYKSVIEHSNSMLLSYGEKLGSIKFEEWLTKLAEFTVAYTQSEVRIKQKQTKLKSVDTEHKTNAEPVSINIHNVDENKLHVDNNDAASLLAILRSGASVKQRPSVIQQVASILTPRDTNARNSVIGSSNGKPGIVLSYA